DDVAGRPARQGTGDRRAVGFRRGASALSGGGLQHVQYRARRRCLAGRAGGARDRSRHAGEGNKADAPVVTRVLVPATTAAAASATAAAVAAPAIAAAGIAAAAIAAAAIAA